MKFGKEQFNEFISEASGMISKQELMEKLGYTSRQFSHLINLMRNEGHEIWVINTDIKEYSIIYKGFEEPSDTPVKEPSMMRFV